MTGISFAQNRRSIRIAVLSVLASGLVISVCIYLLFGYWNGEYLKNADAQRRAALVEMVSLARNTIEPILTNVRNGEISRAEGLEQVRNIVRKMTYRDQYGPNYIFMSSYDGIMLVQPYEPQKEGSNQWELKDDRGTYIIRKLVHTARTFPEGGFVSYYYHPPNSAESEEKLSFVVGIPELDAYIGTGMYLQETYKNQQALFQQTSLWTIVAIGLMSLPMLLSLGYLNKRGQALEAEMAERLKAQEALAHSEERLQLTLDSVDEAMWDWNIPSGEAYFSPRYYTMLGYEPGEFPANYENWRQRVYPEDLDHIEEQINDHVIRRSSGYAVNYRMQKKDGSLCWIMARGRVVERDANGQAVRMVGTHADITERVLAEQALHESEEKYRFLAENVSDTIYRMSLPDGVYEYISPSSSRIFGYTPEEIYARPLIIRDIIHPDYLDYFRREWAKLLAGEVSPIYEYKILHRSGETRWIYQRNTLVKDDDAPKAIIGIVTDITEQKQIEHDLRLARYSMDHAADAIYWIDNQAHIRYANEAACRQLGYTRDELLMMRVYDFVTGFDESMRTSFRQELKEKHIVVIESTHRAKDGRLVPVETLINYVEFEGESFSFAFVRDITERKKAQQALEQSERRFRMVTELISDYIFEISVKPEGMTLDMVTENYSSVTGRSRNSIGSVDEWLTIIHPDDLENFRRQISLVVETGQSVDFECRSLVRDNRLRWINVYARPQWDESYQKVVSIVGAVKDITARKEAEIAFRESQRRLVNLMANLPGVAYRCKNDPTWTMEFVSEGCFNLTGYKAGELINNLKMSFSHLILPEHRDYVWEEVQKAVANKRTYQLQYRIRTKNGDVKWVWEHGGGVYDADGVLEALEGFITDINDRRMAEEKILQLNTTLEERVIERTAQLEAANRELESFSYSVSHDLRAPLRSLNGFSQLLMEDYIDRLDETGQDYLRRIRNASGRMGQLIDALLELSRVSRSEINRVPVDISLTAHEIADDLRSMHPERIVEWVIPPELKTNADPALLRVVLTNLLGNAFKFTGKHAVARIEVGELEDNGKTFYVKDDGAGFDMAYADRLFGAFQRLHDAAEFEGTGIGLALVKRIIVRHGGQIRVESDIEKGTTFYFSFEKGN